MGKRCENCMYLTPDRYAPNPAIGVCGANSQRYGDDAAWSEMGNSFLRIYVGKNFGCVKFEYREPQDAEAQVKIV